MLKRIILDIVLILSVFILPWWVTAIVALAGMFMFAGYYEFLVVAVMMHSLYGIHGTGFAASAAFFYVTALFIFVAIQLLRNNIIFYQK